LKLGWLQRTRKSEVAEFYESDLSLKAITIKTYQSYRENLCTAGSPSLIIPMAKADEKTQYPGDTAGNKMNKLNNKMENSRPIAQIFHADQQKRPSLLLQGLWETISQ